MPDEKSALKNYLELAIEAAIMAGIAIKKVYNKPSFNQKLKVDNSPLTEADTAANIIINKFLKTSNIPIISEENKNSDYDIRKNWKKCWLVDPLDGTKEFVNKNGEFTVNIALCENGIPILGVIYAPNSKELFYADAKSRNAFKRQLKEEYMIKGELYDVQNKISPNPAPTNTIRVVGSRSHMNSETLDFIKDLKQKYDLVEIVSMGSSLKLCMIAEGKADVYPRFAPTMEWDTAAGHAICKAVGLKVLSKNSQDELMYNKEHLLNNHFILQNS
ncbi:3'(2'),5'-bisphosphate nucleotidase [Arenibacter palladensis]|uniref:3'(2'),5'-bisphosphate nucleotidase CysQ n=1 Tax=Arenibacter palladensis TaxID=237373 RepID=A0A1M5EMR6_9FLAO|nr:3'(2'),5'-bisphosphate nucleotidase CysQ [Arenibacter palladensis]SHF80400.1 3'(2'),5'-bisphosphate nucleotidase [Arenibacter palladensis]